MRFALLTVCIPFLLSACSNEPIQQATSAHVSVNKPFASMSSKGSATCAMIGGTQSTVLQLDGSTIGMCALPNGKRCSEQALAVGNCGTY